MANKEDVTAKKTETTAGWRPEAPECIEGWRRVAKGSTSERDLYCSAIVDKALRTLAKRGYSTQVLQQLMAHMVDHGNIRGFKTPHLMERPRFEAQGLEELHALARLAWWALRSAVGQSIRAVPAYHEPAAAA